MKKLLMIIILIIMATNIYAEFGSWEGAIRKDIGNNISVTSINLSSTTGTVIWAPSTQRPDGILFNNSAFIIWLGTDTITTNGTLHTNITNGFPVASSGTFRLDGSMTGQITATADQGVASVNIRIMNGVSNQ